MIYRRIIAVIGVLAISLGMASSMITTASAVAPLVVAGAVVGIGQIFSWVLNEMTGSDAFDLGNIISECIDVSVDFVESIPERVDIGTQYWVSGMNIISDGISDMYDSLVDAGSAVYDFTNTIFDGYTPGQVVSSVASRLGSMINSGELVLGYDENGDVVLSTKDYCNFLDAVYKDFGAEINGDIRTWSTFNISSEYIVWHHFGSFASFSYADDTLSLSDRFGSSFYPFILTDDDIFFLTPALIDHNGADGGRSISPCCVPSYPPSLGHAEIILNDVWYSSEYNYNLNVCREYITLYFSFDPLSHTYDFTITHPAVSEQHINVVIPDQYWTFINFSESIDEVYSSGDVISLGWVGVGYGKVNSFEKALKGGNITRDNVDVHNGTIPNTKTEDVIKDMGLAGVGSSVKPGTVTMDKTGEVTVTDTKTGAAELVENYPDVTDMDLPQMDQLIDKFPFSLPFDLYKLLTVFVAEPKEPIFEIPISTSLSFENVTAEIDEKVTIDFTQFKFNDIDIIQVLVQSGFYILFVAMLVKITPSLIKH